MAIRQPPTRITVNGQNHDIAATPDTLLLYILRNDLDLNAAKYGCGLGRCGACTVHLDGEPAYACLVTVGEVDGRQVTTLEGLGSPENLHPLQRAFIAAAAERAKWGSPLPAIDGLQRGRGFAYARYETAYTYVAIAAEVTVNPASGEVQVTRIVVAHECGQIINPDGVRNQIEGNVIQGISRSLRTGCTLIDPLPVGAHGRAPGPMTAKPHVDHPSNDPRATPAYQATVGAGLALPCS